MQVSACGIIMLLALAKHCTSAEEVKACSKGTCPSSFVQLQDVSSKVAHREETDDADGGSGGDATSGQPSGDVAPKGPPPDSHDHPEEDGADAKNKQPLKAAPQEPPPGDHHDHPEDQAMMEELSRADLSKHREGDRFVTYNICGNTQPKACGGKNAEHDNWCYCHGGGGTWCWCDPDDTTDRAYFTGWYPHAKCTSWCGFR